MAAAMEAYQHRTGCPSVLDPSRAPSRVESYVLERPPTQGGGRVKVTRCSDCGEATYRDVDESGEA